MTGLVLKDGTGAAATDKSILQGKVPLVLVLSSIHVYLVYMCRTLWSELCVTVQREHGRM